MSANLTALDTAYRAKIAELSDDLTKAEAEVACDRYIAAMTSQSELETGSVQSYTIAGRTITRRNAETGHVLIAVLRREFMTYIGGRLLVDMGGYS